MGTANPSHLRGAVRLAIAGVRRRGRGRPAQPVEPSRKLAVEHPSLVIDQKRVRRYLTATRGTGLWMDSPVLPPTYSAVWETALMLELLALDGMPFPSGGIVHMASELVVVRPLRMDDRIRCRIEVERVEAHPRGVLLGLKCRSWNAVGQLGQENATTLLVRGGEAPSRGTRSGGQGPREGGDEGEEPALREWREVASWELSAGAGLAYARASGDFNPIHLWPWSSRLLGFTRPILHGHCSLAMVAHELLRATGRQPRRLLGRFRAPLELPSPVRLEIAGAGDQGGAALRLVRPGREEKPFVEGVWVGAKPPS